MKNLILVISTALLFGACANSQQIAQNAATGAATGAATSVQQQLAAGNKVNAETTGIAAANGALAAALGTPAAAAPAK